ALSAPAAVARELGADRPDLDHRRRRILHASRIRRPRVEIPDLVLAGRHLQPGAGDQGTGYSGPEPPSAGVSRPPFAVIAPHWTQFDAVTSTWPSDAS